MKNCPKCKSLLKKVNVSVAGAKDKILSYQCPTCDYFSFDQKSGEKIVQELKENPLKIHQKIVKISQDRLGIYLNKDIIKSLDLKKGDAIKISIPDKKKILIELQE